MNNTKIIIVLFTRYYSIFANIIYFVGGRGYTHASLALDEKSGYYSSFNIKGFRKEYPRKHQKKSRNSISYKLEVSEDDYERIKKRLTGMEQNKEQCHLKRRHLFIFRMIWLMNSGINAHYVKLSTILYEGINVEC